MKRSSAEDLLEEYLYNYFMNNNQPNHRDLATSILNFIENDVGMAPPRRYRDIIREWDTEEPKVVMGKWARPENE